MTRLNNFEVKRNYRCNYLYNHMIRGVDEKLPPIPVPAPHVFDHKPRDFVRGGLGRGAPGRFGVRTARVTGADVDAAPRVPEPPPQILVLDGGQLGHLRPRADQDLAVFHVRVDGFEDPGVRF